MKIAVLSSYSWIQRANNYGSLFQYYALQVYLEKLNCEVFWIRLNNVSQKRKVFIDSTLEEKITNCQFEFKCFIDNFLNVSTHEYPSLVAFRKNPPQADIYITGSDQVWNGIVPEYFLHFFPKGGTKASYAASFGKNSLNIEEFSLLKKLLSNLDFISVRENSALQLCEQVLERPIDLTCDPTLLLEKEDYLQLIRRDSAFFIDESRPKFVIYLVNECPFTVDELAFIENYANSEGLEVVIIAIQGAENNFPSTIVKMPSPNKWLHLISVAKYVITNSYHGLLFSIIFEKKFMLATQKNKAFAENDRFTTILNRFQLTHRVYTSQKEHLVKISNEIDWHSVRKHKRQFVNHSVQFLNRVIYNHNS